MDKGFKGTINLNGRPKGSKNIATAEIRERFNLLVENNIDKLQKDISSLEPFQRIKVIIELSKFILPTLKSVDIAGTIEAENQFFKTVVVNLIEPNNGNND
jgi:hypothetical protein